MGPTNISSVREIERIMYQRSSTVSLSSFVSYPNTL